MRVVVASGKGGTGKTTVALNLLKSIACPEIYFLDCDVEEPNANIFLNVELSPLKEVTIPLPEVDQSKCNNCGDCGKYCEFKAILPLPKKVIVFPDLCHGCGLCTRVCKTGAITEKPMEIGIVEGGKKDNYHFFQGSLEIGKPAAGPIIEAIKEQVPTNIGTIVIIDSPPGSGCSVVSTVKDSDYGILVTEPTPFGLHDLEIATDVFDEIGIPYGIVINRSGEYDQIITDFASKKGVPILMSIPFDRKIAEYYARGILFTDKMPEWKKKFQQMWYFIEEALK